MFEIEAELPRRRAREAGLSTGVLRAFVLDLARLDDGVPDAERIDQIRLLEELKSAAAAAQAKVVAEFRASQEAEQQARGVPANDVGKGIAAQVALAKRESAARARRYVGWSQVLVAELPHTFRALQAGRITEWRAQIVAKETAWLSREHRERIDEEIAPSVEQWGDRRVENEVKKHAYRLDPHGFLARLAQAEGERRVSLKPAPDCMSSLHALLPVAQGVSVLASLQREADSLRGQGDARTRGQIMADTLVQRVTGQASAESVPARIELVMTDQTFFNTGEGSDEPAHLIGCGTIPAELARRLARIASQEAEAFVRRLYADPGGRLVAMESTSRRFVGGLAEFLVIRDQVCRTPWCDAPVRHKDHVIPVVAGGLTSESNGQGLCEACNQAKEAAGWRHEPLGKGAGESVAITTPTGHRYRSSSPDPPGTQSQPERHLLDLIWAA